MKGLRFFKQLKSRAKPVSFALVFATIAALMLVTSHAQTPTASFEADSGTLAGNISTVADSSAANGQAIMFGSSVSASAPPTGTSLVVDFRNKTQPLDIYSVGVTLSTYNGGGNANINKSATWKANLQALGPLAWRIPFRYNGGNPGSSAGGGQSSGDAVTYVQNIKAIGGQPVIVVGGDTSDNNFTNADAAGLVHYFNDNGGQHGGPVHNWVIGNEYTNGGNDPIGYQAHLNGWAAAMKAADPTITLSAPAAPDMKYADGAISQSITNAGQYIDYLSYHAYQGASAGLGATSDYETYANNFRSTYITSQNFGSRASQVHPALEEFNWGPYYSGDTEFYDWHNVVFVASVIGHSLSGGAHAYLYADSNGPLGLMNDGSGQDGQVGSLYTKFPAYWGLSMWTGLNGTFRRFGNNLVTASSNVNNIEVYATDNGKIMLINKDTTDHTLTIGLGGKTNGTYNMWQTSKTNPTFAPSEVAASTAYSNATISLTLPAGTVSSVEL
jgi:hypothetical protein